MKTRTSPWRAAGLAAALFGLTAAGCESLPESLIWKNPDADQTRASRDQAKPSEITPRGLEGGMATPISAEEARRTALSRPKVVSVEEPGKTKTEKKYFDVVEERQQTEAAPVIDEAARPVKIVTFDNNSVQKDYPMTFNVAWGRLMEALLELPLSTVDRSSGLIVTDWVRDESAGAAGLMGLNPFAGSSQAVRYKYTIRALDRGGMTQVKVVPHAQIVSGQQWTPARPSLTVTERMFTRIERELAVPLPSERY